MSSDDSINKLEELGALFRGHFVLASGKHSGHYVQVAQIGRQPRALHGLLEQCQDALTALSFDTVYSAAIGGIVIGQQLALLLDKPSVFAERKDNVMMLRRGFQFAKGEKLLMVEDVVTTGGTLKELRALAEAAGAEVVGVFSLINRSGLETWEGLPFISRFQVQFPVYEADAVPADLASIPVSRPGSKKV